MTVRDHTGIPLDKFNGLFNQGDFDTVPIDHFSDCNNIDFQARADFGTRAAINISQTVGIPISNIKRIYNYPTQNANTLIILTYDDDLGRGSIYHFVNPTTVFGPILTINGMTDFAFQPFAGRAYISPFGNYQNGDLIFQKGLQGQVLYVYAGDGTPARPAAGNGIAGSMTIANGAAGFTDPGLHVFGFVSQTISGYNSPPTLLGSFTTLATNSVSFGSIPTSGDPTVVKRLLVATKAIPTFDGNLSGYQFFFVPNAVINNNTDTFLNNISFYDSQLLADASHLLNNYTSIPAGAVLTTYHNRLCLAATFTDISLVLVSQPGEPEAIDQIVGLIVFPLDGNPITNAQELRDVLYLFKRSRTIAFVDNQGDPSSWPLVVIDNALGTCVHGIGTVLDSGGTSIDFLLIVTYEGLSQFNGRYVTPELRLSWKIYNIWFKYDKNRFNFVQVLNDPIKKKIYVITPSRNMLIADYANGMDAKNVRWSFWSFRMGINTLAIYNINQFIVGADLQ